MNPRSESIGYWLSAIHRHTMIYLDRETVPLNIGSGQAMFLAHLYHRDGVSQEELSRELKFDKATTARAISKLEKEGLVRRNRDPGDRRAYRVSLTGRGRDAGDELRVILRGWTETLARGLTARERRLLVDMLQRVFVNATDATCGGAGGERKP